MSPAQLTSPIACRCLRVTEAQVTDAVVLFGCESVREVTQVNDAGGGCTACHCKIRQLILEARQRAGVTTVDSLGLR